jgi:hypothetical protein
VGKALLGRLGTFIQSLDKFTDKQEPSTIKNIFAAILWVEIIGV